MYPAPRAQGGFTLTEIMLVVAFVGTLTAIAVPLTGDIRATIKLNEAARQVQREFAEARLRAVSSNRSLRVRTNCPSAGFVRTVEVVGTAAIDNAANRCTHAAYPFPPDNDLMTRPNYDGPDVPPVLHDQEDRHGTRTRAGPENHRHAQRQGDRRQRRRRRRTNHGHLAAETGVAFKNVMFVAELHTRVDGPTPSTDANSL